MSPDDRHANNRTPCTKVKLSVIVLFLRYKCTAPVTDVVQCMMCLLHEIPHEKNKQHVKITQNPQPKELAFTLFYLQESLTSEF